MGIPYIWSEGVVVNLRAVRFSGWGVGAAALSVLGVVYADSVLQQQAGEVL